MNHREQLRKMLANLPDVVYRTTNIFEEDGILERGEDTVISIRGMKFIFDHEGAMVDLLQPPQPQIVRCTNCRIIAVVGGGWSQLGGEYWFCPNCAKAGDTFAKTLHAVRHGIEL